MAFPTSLDAFPSAATLHAGTLATAPAHSGLHGAMGAALVAMETKMGIDGSTDPASFEGRMVALEAAVAAFVGGWFVDAHTWTRTGAGQYQFTVTAPTDQSHLFDTGLKVSWQDDGTGGPSEPPAKYGVVSYPGSPVASATPGMIDTPVNLIPNDDFPVATNILPNPRFSSVDSPIGFPGLFNWAPALTTSGTSLQQGNRGSSHVNSGRWRLTGKFLEFEFSIGWGGASISQGVGVYRISLPVVPRNVGDANIAQHSAVGVVQCKSGGSEFPGTLVIPAGSPAPQYMIARVIDRGWLQVTSCQGGTGTGSSAQSHPQVWAGGDWIQGTALIPLPV